EMFQSVDRQVRRVGRGGSAVIGGGGYATRKRHGGVLWGKDSQIAYLVTPHLGHNHVHKHFRLGFVDVIHHLLRQSKLVRRAFNNDGVLRRNVLNALHLQHGTDRIHNILQVRGGGNVAEVESLDHVLFQFAALGLVVLSHENRIRRDRAPESARLQS